MSAAAKYCRKCGNALAADDAFCPKCGAPQEEASAATDGGRATPAWMSESRQAGSHSGSATPPSAADEVAADRPKTSAGSIGCGALIIVCVVLAVFGAIFGDDDATTSSSRTDTYIPMRGSIIVMDQRTCSNGARVKVSSGPIWQESVKFPDTNAPCNLYLDIKVPPKADSYKIEVGNLPAVIMKPSDMRKKDSRGEEFFEINLIVGE